MTTKIYTIGYTGRKPEEIKQAVRERGAVLLDIRFSPRSRVPQWTKKRLTELLGERYKHVKALGNINYKGGPIELVDFEAGKAIIDGFEVPVVLMCACKDQHRCHRTTVAQMLQAQGDYQIQEIGQSSPPRQPQLSLGF